MAQKLSKKYTLSINGLITVCDDGNIVVSVEDTGDFNLSHLMSDFNDKVCKISVSYDEELGSEE